MSDQVEKAFARAAARRDALENALGDLGFSVSWVGDGTRMLLERPDWYATEMEAKDKTNAALSQQLEQLEQGVAAFGINVTWGDDGSLEITGDPQ